MGMMKNHEMFYDSLEYKAKKNSITGLLYDFLISQPGTSAAEIQLPINIMLKWREKSFPKFQLIRLRFSVLHLKILLEMQFPGSKKLLMPIHTTSSKSTIENMLLFKVGDFLDPDLMYENERIIRSLRYIQDVRFILEQDSVYKGLVKVHVVTKDRFPFGVTGDVNGIQFCSVGII
jgi:hypothetical protein